MDDHNEMARLHSAGATVRHKSPFDNLPAHKNGTELTADFIKKWAVPYYMKIASYNNSEWINEIKKIKHEITTDICLLLLGDFNWRTRLVGSYFAAVKGYKEFVDIIGSHLLKSEVCCVGHVYALTLAFFNDEHCIQYLKKYLDYYLTKPSLYFDQKFVMEAVLYLDKENKTDYFSKLKESWKVLMEERSKFEKRQAQEVAKMLQQLEGVNSSDKDFAALQTGNERQSETFSTEFFDKQIAILRELSNSYK